MCRKIKKLDLKLAQHVRSGVQITDVVAGVREVVQNSIDAEATNINVLVCMGPQMIQFKVMDDGRGISPDDLELVGERYCTSKVRDLGQLRNTATFGFRGEALSSLKSVADLMIISKTEGYNASFRKLIVNGKKQDVRMVDGSSQSFGEIRSTAGTIVHATHMFETIPVRHRYLLNLPRSKFLEDLRPVILQCSINYPGVNLVIKLKDQTAERLVCKVIASGPEVSFQDHVASCFNSIFGIGLRRHSNYLQVSYKHYRIECVIGTLPVQTRAHQYIYYNTRELKDKKLFQNINRIFSGSEFGEGEESILASTISKKDISPRKGASPTKAATSTGTPYKTFPVFVVKIKGPVSGSDLVQDPSKEIVKLKHFDIIEPLIMKLMKQFLRSRHYKTIGYSKVAPTNETGNGTIKDQEDVAMKVIPNNRLIFGVNKTKEFTGLINTKDNCGDHVEPHITQPISWDNRNLKRRRFPTFNGSQSCQEDDENTAPLMLDNSVTRDMLRKCKVISQVDKKFILIKSQTSLFIIDQHACDERIRIEQNISNFISIVHNPFTDVGIPLKDLRFAFSVSLPELELFETFESQCFKWGIKYLVCKQGNKVEVTHLPELMMKKVDSSGLFLKKCILQYLYDLQTNTKLREISTDWWLAVQSIPSILIELMNSKACREAIMFGDELTKQDCESLISELTRCKNPFYCAHGRPSVVPIYNLGTGSDTNKNLNDV